MKCQKCGTEYEGNFCSKCGTPNSLRNQSENLRSLDISEKCQNSILGYANTNFSQSPIYFKLPKKVEKDLLNGVSIAKCKKNLKKFPLYKDKSPRELQEILFTASTFLMAERSARDFEKDFEYYKISPVFDNMLCNDCKKISVMKFRFKDRVPGINFPPFHAGCRCSIEIAVDDWGNWMDNYVKQKKK